MPARRTCACGCGVAVPRGRKLYAGPLCSERARLRAKLEARAEIAPAAPARRPSARGVQVDAAHPLAGGAARTVTAERLAHYDALGPGPIECLFCGQPTQWPDLIVRLDHGGQRRPACRPCSPLVGALLALLRDERAWAKSEAGRAVFDSLNALAAAAREGSSRP